MACVVIELGTLSKMFDVGLVNTVPEVRNLLGCMWLCADPIQHENLLELRRDANGRTWPISIGFCEPNWYFPELGLPEAPELTDAGVLADTDDTEESALATDTLVVVVVDTEELFEQFAEDEPLSCMRDQGASSVAHLDLNSMDGCVPP